MATADQDVEMGNYHYSSSPELSSLPSESPSEPGSPSRHDQRRTSLGRGADEIVVDSPAAHRFALLQQQSHPSTQMQQPFSLDGVRLTKDGVPRKKPGRKPGTIVKKASDGTTPTTISSATPAGSGVEAAKPRRARKPKDPNAPPVPRKKRTQPTSAPTTEPSSAAGPSRSTSANQHFQPKIELTSMRMDIDSRPAPPAAGIFSAHPPHPRQPPLTVVDKAPKREPLPNSMQSILNADDSPPRPPPAAPTSTTPVRSVGQNYDPVRSATYDPVRETMLSRDPYGTGPLGSPRAPTQIVNRASASPSIASLVDPAPVPHARSPAATASSISHQVSPPPASIAAATGVSSSNAQIPRYRDNVVSLPTSPSPVPAIRPTVSSSSSSSAQSQPSGAKTAAVSSSSPPTTATTKKAPATIPALALTSKSSQAKASSSGAKASASKSEINGQGKFHSRPPPPPPVPASAKSAASKSASTKVATQKASAGKSTTANTNATASDVPGAAAAALSKPSGSVLTSFRDVAMTGTGSANAPPNQTGAPLVKKFSSILQQERGGKQNKAATSATSSPKLAGAKGDGLPSVSALDPAPNGAGEPERSILDFGKARPGEELSTPSIVLHVPLVRGENNKYVNFMRLAEERYGWDALHPRLAAHRDRKLRIAAASAALERNGSGRESGDEMTDDMQSGDEGSNEETGGGAGDNPANGVNASGPDEAPAKPARKKRIFKMDEYDKDDDFVDDSEMLWEEQAAASRDGFFVYSGPLVPEEEKPAEGTTAPTKRGRGTRGGRGGAARSGGARSGAGRSSGGAGSRGGATRKPRATKQEKEQREREKAEHGKASHAASAKAAANGLSFPGTNPPFSAGMAIDV
ncbi:histone promoter control protein [Niveomyces insectorum RCEF 264]|uniref:Histone promoter control protein n=1 Tax=Niveomyces insectorum RCEF 264 TaxID=1081102 RepID=A0A167XQI4_9HYPO|nr:histone promoter control protein [Niveomyces insectorum RCEF 264]